MSGHFADPANTRVTSTGNDLTQECPSTNELIPAPLPPRQTMSYASAMKNRGTSPRDQTSSQQFVNSAISIQTDTGSDSGVELESGSTTSSDSEVASTKDITNPLKDCPVTTTASLPLSSAEDELLSGLCLDSNCRISAEPMGKMCE
ncbi:hypothetical protein COOONC_24149 [Cooperia oncophora]